MAKPILVITFPLDHLLNDIHTSQALNEIKKDYHILIVAEPKITEIKIECFNDCKGLPDVDIEKLINDLKTNSDGNK